jgi:hypothetical protein
MVRFVVRDLEMELLQAQGKSLLKASIALSAKYNNLRLAVY